MKSKNHPFILTIFIAVIAACLTALTACSNAETTSSSGGGENPNPFSFTLTQGDNTVDLDGPLTYGAGTYVLTVTNNDPALADDYAFSYSPSNAITVSSPTSNTITFQVANADSRRVSITATHSSDNSLSGSTILNLAKASYSPTEYPVTYAPTNTISVNGTYTVSPSVNNILTSFPKYPLRVSVDPPLSAISISNDGKVYLTTAGNPSTNIVTVTFSSSNYVDFTTNFYVQVHTTPVPQAVLTLSSGTTPFTFGAGNYIVTAHLTNSDGSRVTNLSEKFNFVARPADAIVGISSNDTSYTFAVTNASYGNVSITATHQQNNGLLDGQSFTLAKADYPNGTIPIAYNATNNLRIPTGGSGSISAISDVRTSYYPQDTTLTSVSGLTTYSFNADTGAITFTGIGSYSFNLTFVSSNYNNHTSEFGVEVTLPKTATYSSDLTALEQVITDGNLGTVSASTDALVVDTLGRVTTNYTASTTVTAIYATESGAGNNSGTSWANAIPGIALRSAIIDISDASENKVYLVLVAEGTYSITDQRGSSGNQEFQMKNHTAIIGGFHLSESSDNISVSRSGTTAFDGGGVERVFFNNDNGVDLTAVLYGVTIQNGNISDGDGGGGMRNFGTSPSVINTKFINNTSLVEGGGLYAQNSRMYIKGSQFISNASTAASGGGLYAVDSAIIVEDTVFKHNSANGGGGAIREFKSSGLYVNVSLVSNTSGTGFLGGGVSVNGSTVLVNTTLVGNNGGRGGFATILTANQKPRIINSLLWANNPTNIYLNNGFRGQNLNIGASILQGHTNGIAVANTTNNANTVTSTNIVDTDPGVTVTGNYPTIATGSSAENAGYYVRISGQFDQNGNGAGATLYFSENTTDWYTDVTLRTAATLPANTRLLTGTDITGTARTGRPDIGAYEAR